MKSMDFTLKVRPPIESNSDLRKFLGKLFDNSLKNIFSQKLYPVNCKIFQKTHEAHALEPFAFDELGLEFKVRRLL